MSMKPVFRATGAAALFALLGASSASALTYNFAGSGGDIGKSAAFGDITAIAINTEEPHAPVLRQNLSGIGVYSGFLSGFPSGWVFDGNQLDNTGDDEAIVFDMGGLFQAQTMTLTQTGLGDNYQIYGSNDASVALCTTGGLACLTSVSTLLASGTGYLGGEISGNLSVDLTGSGPYSFFVATTPGGSGSGYRVQTLTAAAVPLPAAGLLLLGGLGGLAALRRKRKAA